VRFAAAIRSRQRSPAELFFLQYAESIAHLLKTRCLFEKSGLPSKEYNLLQISVSEQKIIV